MHYIHQLKWFPLGREFAFNYLHLIIEMWEIAEEQWNLLNGSWRGASIAIQHNI